jgi:hypothetical protein
MNDKLSVYAEGEREAERFKWIESEKAGRDLGAEAVDHWINRYWSGYCRTRLVEHLNGRRYWQEFGQEHFGLLGRQFCDDPLLLDRIMDRISDGQENLDVIGWALDWGLNMDDVIDVLEALDVNRHRIAFRAVCQS